MKHQKLTRFASLAAVAALTLAACGSDGGSSGGSTAASKTEPAASSSTASEGGSKSESDDMSSDEMSSDEGSEAMSSEAGGESEASGDQITLNYWTWFPAEETLNKVIAAYEADHPNIKIELREFAAADYQKQLPLALNGGDDIDIAAYQVEAMSATATPFLLPVSEWADNLPADWESQLDANMVKQTAESSSDGELYGLPLGSIGTPVLFYNATMLADSGVATAPTTVDEMVAAAEQIKAANPDVKPLLIPGDPYWQVDIVLALIGQNNPELANQLVYGEAEWNSPEVVAAIEAYKAWYDAGVVDNSTLSLLGGDAMKNFQEGGSAFVLDGTYSSSILSAPYREANSIPLDDIGAVALPLVNNGTVSSRSFAEGGMGIPASSKHPAEAADFISFMFFGEGLDIWAGDLVLVPSRVGYEIPSEVLQSPAAVEGYARMQEAISNPGPNRQNPQSFMDPAGNAIIDVINGNKTAQEAADYLQSEWASGRYEPANAE